MAAVRPPRLRSLPRDSADLRRLLAELAEKIETENKDRETDLPISHKTFCSLNP